MRVTMQDQARLIAWAEPRMGVETGRAPPETIALGVVDQTGALRAVIWFNAFYSTHASAHIASDGSRSWSSRRVWRVIFAFAFDHLSLTRLTLVIPRHKIKAVIMALKLGFHIEGVARCGANDGTDGILFGMLAQECRWLPQSMKERISGKVIATTPAGNAAAAGGPAAAEARPDDWAGRDEGSRDRRAIPVVDAGPSGDHERMGAGRPGPLQRGVPAP